MKKNIFKMCSLLLIGMVSVNAGEITQQNVPAGQNIEKVKPISIPGIRYNKGLEQFSVFSPTKEGFDDYVTKNNINAYTVKDLFNRLDNPKSIILSALGYDYGHQRPDLAENFYEKIDPKTATLDTKIRQADFYLRTGRVEKIDEVLNERVCLSNFKVNSDCYYYIGLSQYLRTGDNQNKFLNLAKPNNEKAKQIFLGQLK